LFLNRVRNVACLRIVPTASERPATNGLQVFNVQTAKPIFDDERSLVCGATIRRRFLRGARSSGDESLISFSVGRHGGDFASFRCSRVGQRSRLLMWCCKVLQPSVLRDATQRPIVANFTASLIAKTALSISCRCSHSNRCCSSRLLNDFSKCRINGDSGQQFRRTRNGPAPS